jgi:F0F1-type ATP synthase membrane subunit a
MILNRLYSQIFGLVRQIYTLFRWLLQETGCMIIFVFVAQKERKTTDKILQIIIKILQNLARSQKQDQYQGGGEPDPGV